MSNVKWQKPTPQNRYAWEAAYEVLNRFVREVGTAHFTRAWIMTQRMLESVASCYRPDEPEPVAKAMAWEDFEMACRGRGSPLLAGGFFQMWSRCPGNYDKAFELALSRAFDAALKLTDPRILRYPAAYRQGEMATLTKNFQRGEATPVDDARWHGVVPGEMSDWLEEAHPELQAPEPRRLVVLEGGLSDRPPAPRVIRRKKDDT